MERTACGTMTFHNDCSARYRSAPQEGWSRSERAAAGDKHSMAEQDRPFVVGIGASAGGLQSLERFFDGLEHLTGAAFIVVQHLSPNYETMMDKLLGRHT
jgi:chemotaxis response regulator CheB